MAPFQQPPDAPRQAPSPRSLCLAHVVTGLALLAAWLGWTQLGGVRPTAAPAASIAADREQLPVSASTVSARLERASQVSGS